jgi:hypothetical protein
MVIEPCHNTRDNTSVISMDQAENFYLLNNTMGRIFLFAHSVRCNPKTSLKKIGLDEGGVV